MSIQAIEIVSAKKECTENIDEVKTAEITLAGHDNLCVCSHTICVILAVIALGINIGIGAYFAYSRWYLKKARYSY